MTLEIIVNSFMMLYKNFKAYVQILLPYIALSILTTFIYKWDFYQGINSISDGILHLLSMYILMDAIVKIHRFNILGDINFYEFGIFRNFKYFIAALILTILLYLFLVIMILGVALFEKSIIFTILGFILGFLLLLYLLPYVFILPIIATDNKLRFSEFKKSLQGFRLTLFIQGLFFALIIILNMKFYPLIFGKEIYDPVTNYENIFILIFEIITFAYTVNLITETFKFWNKKYNFYNFT